MEKIDLIISNSHFIIKLHNGKRLLVDSGCPVSFCGNDGITLSFGDVEHSLLGQPDMLRTINRSGIFEGDVDGIVGMDLLRDHSFVFDKLNGNVLVDAPFNKGEFVHTIPLEVNDIFYQCCLLVNLEINNRPIKAILDTGAWISYLSSEHLDGAELLGPVKDFNPILGEIHSTKHIVKLSFGDYSQMTHVAKMTSEIEMMSKGLGVDMFLGLDAICCNKIRLDVPNRRLCF